MLRALGRSVSVRRLAPQPSALPAALLRLRCVPPSPAPCGAVACLAKQAKGKGKGGKAKGKGKGKAAKDEEEEEEEDAAEYVEVDMEDVKRRMQGAVDKLQREFSAITAGRATPSMLDLVMVSSDGGPVPLPSVAKVMLQGPQALQARAPSRLPTACDRLPDGAPVGGRVR